MTELLTYISIFLFGGIAGSFINVLIDRIPKGKDIVFKRSHCDHCAHTLAPLDLVPIFSYIFLCGKCRYCSKKISIQNPAVEITTGMLFVFAFYFRTGLNEFIYQLLVAGALIAIFVIDIKEGIIPDILVIFLVLATFLYHLLFLTNSLFPDLICGTVFALLFLLLVFITRGRGMGLGDVKFAYYMGFYLGFDRLIPAFYLAFLTGALISSILVITRRKSLKSTIPFGPFLVAATVISYYYGFAIMNFFRNLMF